MTPDTPSEQTTDLERARRALAESRTVNARVKRLVASSRKVNADAEALHERNGYVEHFRGLLRGRNIA